MFNKRFKPTLGGLGLIWLVSANLNAQEGGSIEEKGKTLVEGYCTACHGLYMLNVTAGFDSAEKWRSPAEPRATTGTSRGYRARAVQKTASVSPSGPHGQASIAEKL